MIYIFLANGFEEIEAVTTIDILRRAQLKLATVAVADGLEVTGAHGITVKADMLQSELQTDDMDGVILPGGMPGTLNLEKSPIVKAAIRYCIDNGKRIMAICAAPSIFGHMGLLENKKAVCYPGFENELKGAFYTDALAVTDGTITTSKGPGTAVDFGLEIVTMYKGKSAAQAIRDAMQCQ